MDEFALRSTVNRVLILGAGASADYGLPLWNDLGSLVKEALANDVANNYKYKAEITKWVDKIGNDYSTIDECISRESIGHEYRSNGDAIENELFTIIKEIFKNKYKDNEGGWIKNLNQKILSSRNLEDQIDFIDYNYDNVLNRNFLDFSHLSAKEQRTYSKPRLDNLSLTHARVLYPHGNFFVGEALNDRLSHIKHHLNTTKSGSEHGYLDVVSCHDPGSDFSVYRSYDASSKIELYFLGLGGGMTTNMKKIYFRNPISDIHVTINSKNLENELIAFLCQRYKKNPEEIKIYETCTDLVEHCFDK